MKTITLNKAAMKPINRDGDQRAGVTGHEKLQVASKGVGLDIVPGFK